MSCPGPISKLFSGLSPVRILIAGLHGAGKTTILEKLQLGDVVPTPHASGFNEETVEFENIIFTIWDVKAREKRLPAFQKPDYLIFVVDSNGRDTIVEARNVLRKMMKKNELQDAGLLVFANKYDLPNAMHASLIIQKLRLHKIKQQWYIQSTSATNEEGLFEGFSWLTNDIASKMSLKASSGSDDDFADFAALLEAELDSTSDTSPQPKDDDDIELSDLHRVKKRKVELVKSVADSHGSTSEGVSERALGDITSAKEKDGAGTSV